ncbi:MAG: tape measure protein [Rubrivivax sp.]|nr:tape measure protein [Rubrivivax sp.]
MATNRRDVVLGVKIESDGAPVLTELAGAVRGLGASAGNSQADLDRLAAELDQLTAAKKAAREVERSQAAALAETRRELGAQRSALELLNAGADKATRSTVEYQAALRAANTAIAQSRAALREKTAALATAAASTRAAVAAEADHVAAIQRTAAAARASAATQAAAGATVRGELDKIGAALNTVQTLAGAALGGTLLTSAARDVADAADAFNNLGARVRLATGDSADFQSTFAQVFEIAQRTGVAVDDVGALFVKLAQAGRELNLTNRDALALTESITQALQLSGASASEAASGVQQFAQALASGRLQGDELRSILENAPRLARALSEGLGVTVGQLRELGSQGALTAAQVINALQGQSAALQSEFDQLPPTVGRALANLSTAWTRYVGEVDQANGVSAAAAEAINSLASNLDTLGTLLFSAGKAAAAWQALKLAQTMLGIATATRAATVETVALATAQTAAGTAATGAAASAGRFAAILGGFKVAALLAIITNFRELGTWIGEGIAKLAGYDDKLKETEEELAANDRAARAMAASVAALAQESAKAAEEAAGLTTESRRLLGEFDQVRQKGESVADALGKVQKALDLSDLSGITAAGAALDVLAQRGAITGAQLRDTLAGALKDVDLGVFEAQARAAFDSSTQGARRLAAALDALADESLRRAGTSVRELETGFTEAASSAINDVDALATSLEALGADAGTTGRLLAAALDRATDAAGTERALQAVIDRVEELGRQGKLSGETLTAALEGARKKLDELKPGVDSLAEALRTFGIKTRDELQATADTLGKAYRVIANDVSVSLADKARAFAQFRDAAIAANGGVESSEIKLQARIIEAQAAAAGLGSVIESSMGRAKRATDAATEAVNRYGERLNQAAGSLGGTSAGVAGPGGEINGGKTDSVLGPTGSSDFGVDLQVPVPEGYYYTLNGSDPNVERSAGYDPLGRPYGGYFAKIPGYRPDGANAPGVGPFGGTAGARAPTPAPAPISTPAPAPAGAAGVIRVELTFAGRTASVPTTEEGAAALVALLKEAERQTGA